jgi:hypothetical protein
MLSFRLSHSKGRGTFLIRAADGREDFEVRMRFDDGLSGYQVCRGGEPLACRAASGLFARGGPAEAEREGDKETGRQGDKEASRREDEQGRGTGEKLVTVSLIDQQFLLALDDLTLVRWPYRRGATSPAPIRSLPNPNAPLLQRGGTLHSARLETAQTAALSPRFASVRTVQSTTQQELNGRGASRPFALGAQGIDLRIEQLRVYRDVYYALPPGLPRAAGPVTLGADQYFVLGDNSPVSDDSRLWPQRGVVDGELLWGKPFVAIPLVPFDWGKCGHFQVPNLGRMRYIP